MEYEKCCLNCANQDQPDSFCDECCKDGINYRRYVPLSAAGALSAVGAAVAVAHGSIPNVSGMVALAKENETDRVLGACVDSMADRVFRAPWERTIEERCLDMMEINMGGKSIAHKISTCKNK